MSEDIFHAIMVGVALAVIMLITWMGQRDD